jgi:hypothetical protein
MAQLDGTTGGQEVAGWGGATALTPYVEGGAVGALRVPAPRVSSTLPCPLACFCVCNLGPTTRGLSGVHTSRRQ